MKALYKEIKRIYKILKEFIYSFYKLHNIGHAVAFFGSSYQSNVNKPYEELARTIAEGLAKKGFAIITGAGGATMQAANEGAIKGDGKSCGLFIKLPHEFQSNPYVDPDYLIRFDHYFPRKVAFIRYSNAFLFFPGGYGTLDELFEALNLIKSRKTPKFPVILIGKAYWKKMMEFLNDPVLKEKKITEKDLNLITLSDDANEVIQIVCKYYRKKEYF